LNVTNNWLLGHSVSLPTIVQTPSSLS